MYSNSTPSAPLALTVRRYIFCHDQNAEQSEDKSSSNLHYKAKLPKISDLILFTRIFRNFPSFPRESDVFGPKSVKHGLIGATDRPVFLSDRDFHPTVGAYSQAHS